MLLTIPMFVAGISAGICQWCAHQLMRDRTYLTPIPRYCVGVSIALLWFSLAYVTDPRQHPVSGIWYVFGVSGVGTWIGHEMDRKMATAEDADRLAGYIAAEHDEQDTRDQR